MSETKVWTIVFHLSDDRLFQTFVENIPRAELVAPLRADERLRNAHFPGFRISEKLPTQKQLVTAFRGEVIQRKNIALSDRLCQAWIDSHTECSSAVLESLGISPDNWTDKSWLKIAQTTLKEDSSAERIGAAVRTLVGRFSTDELLICFSIIGYGLDQQALRSAIETELRAAVDKDEDLPNRVVRLRAEVEVARVLLVEIDEARERLTQQSAAERVALEDSITETNGHLDEIEQQLAAAKTNAENLSTKINQLSLELKATTKQVTEYTSRAEKLSRTMKHQRGRLLELVAQQTKDIAAAEERHQNHLTLVESLSHNLTETENALTVKVAETSSAHENSAIGEELIGNNALCYQGVQRIFRNTIVSFIRERMVRLFPADHIQRVKRLFGDHWDDAAANALKSRQTGGTTTVIRDEYDLLGVNHFHEIIDKFYDKLFTAAAGQPPDLVKPNKTKLLGNLKTIKDGRDPISHPVEEELSFEEAHHLLIEAKQILAWLGYEKQAADVSALALKLDGGQAEQISIVKRLPSEDSIYQEFVGRGQVLEEIAACFAGEDNRRCLLAGDGGKGKSAVAYRFAKNLSASPGRFQVIIWLSAKRRRFEAGKVQNIDVPDFTTFEEAIDRLLGEYGATEAELAKSLTEKRRVLMEYLDTLPAFIIADDIDTVLDEHQIVSLFTYEIPHTKSAVLLTSRRDIPGIKSLVIKGFDAKETIEFVKSRVQLLKLDGSQFSPSITNQIAKVTDGSPLYMDDLLRLARLIPITNAIALWNEKKGDEARRYALQREMENLGPDARKVLVAAAITDDSISFAELEAILEISQERLYSALDELRTLFLVPEPSVVEGEQRFQINLNTKKLVRSVEAGSALYERVERASKAVAGKFQDVGHGVVRSLIRQALLKLGSARFNEAETILRDAIDRYPGSSAELKGYLGHAYRIEGRISEARTQFDAASKLKGSRREMFLNWVRMEITEKEWARTVAASDRGLKAFPDFYELREIKVFALRQAGFDFHRGLHREKAEKNWREAVEEIKRHLKAPEDLANGERKYNASMLRSVVVSLHMLGHGRERDQWLERWEREHPDDPEVDRQKEFLASRRGNFAAT